jgi:hypothetical protein
MKLYDDEQPGFRSPQHIQFTRAPLPTAIPDIDEFRAGDKTIHVATLPEQ